MYRGAINACTEGVWIWQLLGEIKFLVEALTVLHYDNQSAIYVIDNPITHSNMKHV